MPVFCLTRYRIPALVMTLALAPPLALAQSAFTYQGRLRDANGAVTGPVELRFRLYDALTGGNQLGAEEIENIASLPDGQFTATLNEAGNFGATTFDGSSRWIELLVNGTLLTPRVQITSAPYGLFSYNTRGLAVNSGGSLGVGTSTPLSRIDAVANLPAPEAAIKGTNAGTGYGVYGFSSALAGVTYGVHGKSDSSSGVGVFGNSTAATGNTFGVYGNDASTSGAGVFGTANAGSGPNKGMWGRTLSTTGRAVFGEATANSGINYGIYGVTQSPDGFAGFFDGPVKSTAMIESASGGFRFPDGSVQSTAATGSGCNPWACNGININNTNSGNVGIGTVSPASALHVSGGQATRVRIDAETGVSGADAKLDFNARNSFLGAEGHFAIGVSSANEFYVDDTSPLFPLPPLRRLTIDDGGRLGIGVNAAGGVVHIQSPHSPPPGSLGAGENGLLLGTTGDLGYKWIQSYNGHLALNPQGNFVGIGTSTPMHTLDVAGTLGMRTSSDSISVMLTADAGSGDGSILLRDDGIRGVGLWAENTNPVGGGHIVVYNDADLPAVSLVGDTGTVDLIAPNGATSVTLSATNGTDDGYLSLRDSNLPGVGIWAENTNAVGGGHLVMYNDSGAPTVQLIGDQGDANHTGRVITGVLEITGGSDLAEPFDINRGAGLDLVKIEPGMVVSIDPDHPGQLKLASKSYDRTVAGVISGAGGVSAGMVMGQRGTIADGKHPVALTGRAYVWCDASSGAIEPGDLLTTGSLAGHAMRVNDYAKAQGAIIGKAMTRLEGGRDLVLVLVSLQ